MSDTIKIQKVFDRIYDKFRYKTDKDNHDVVEQWDYILPELLGDTKYVYGDCEEFAMSAALLLDDAQLPKKNIAICYCELLENGKSLGGHLTCKVYDRDRESWYILDCNFNRPMKRSTVSRDFKWISCMRLDRPGLWVWDEV